MGPSLSNVGDTGSVQAYVHWAKRTKGSGADWGLDGEKRKTEGKARLRGRRRRDPSLGPGLSIAGTGRVGTGKVWVRRRCQIDGWGHAGPEVPLESSGETEGRGFWFSRRQS